MFSGVVLFFLLVSFLPLQIPRGIQSHYEKAEELRRKGDLTAAEAEYDLILGEGYLELARVRSAQADYITAVNFFETAARYRPVRNDFLIELAIAYFHAEQYDKSLTTLNGVAASDPNNTAAHHMLGKTHFMLGNFERATDELQTASRLAPKDTDVAYTLGLAYLKQQKLPAAREIYDGMAARLGNQPQLRVLIGRAYRETGFLTEAIEEFKQALALDPHFPRVHYYLGLTYLLKGGVEQLGKAREEFQIELAAHPNEFLAHYYLGIAATVERNWSSAVEYLRRASALQPDNADPYFFLGQAFQGMEKYADAVAVFKKSIELNPDFKHNDYQVTNAHYRLGQCLIKLGLTQQGQDELSLAAKLKTAAFKRDEVTTQAFTANQTSKISELVAPEGVTANSAAPESATRPLLEKEAKHYQKLLAATHNNIGLLRAERQDFAKAAEHFAIAVKFDPELDGVNFNFGLASYKSENYREALAPLEKEILAHPQNFAAKQLLGLSYFMTDDYPHASALLSEVVAAKPNEAAIYYPLSLSLINQNKTDEANQYIQKMLVVGGNSPQVHILLGRASYDQGDSAKALEELQSALSLDNKILLAHFYSGVVYLKLGKFEEARKEFEAELTLNPHDFQARYDLGYVLLAGQDTARGIKLMQELVAEKPQFADAHYELGKALVKIGDLTQAILSLETAAKLDPDKPHIRYQLGRAYLAAGRKAEGDGQIEISRQLKEKERVQTNP